MENIIGFLITGGASVVVATVGGWFMLEAKKRPPAAEPTPIQDVWKENAERGGTIKDQDKEIRLLRQALMIAFDWIERALRAWVHPDKPPSLSRREYDILEKTGEDLPFEPTYDDKEPA